MSRRTRPPGWCSDRPGRDRSCCSGQDTAPASAMQALASEERRWRSRRGGRRSSAPGLGGVLLGERGSHLRAAEVTVPSGQSRERRAHGVPVVLRVVAGRRQRPQRRRESTAEASAASESKSPWAGGGSRQGDCRPADIGVIEAVVRRGANGDARRPLRRPNPGPSRRCTDGGVPPACATHARRMERRDDDWPRRCCRETPSTSRARRRRNPRRIAPVGCVGVQSCPRIRCDHVLQSRCHRCS